MGRDLISKITAGGLSAGIFLLWWPLHLPTEGLVWLILRGVFWTLACEALLLAFVPLERMLHGGLKTERIAGLSRRLQAAPVRARAAGALVLAMAGFGVPVSLLTTGAAEQLPTTTATRVVVKEVVVERPVIRKRVVVQQVVEAPSAPVAAVTSSGSGSSEYLPARASAPRGDRPAAVRRPAERNASRDAGKRQASKPADTTGGPRDDRSTEAAPETPAAAVPDDSSPAPAGSASSADHRSSHAQPRSSPAPADDAPVSA